MKEITRKTVLLDCLQIKRQQLNVCSKNYNGMEPAPGLEQVWQETKKEVEILQDLIHAYECEPVKRALADWQKEIMQQEQVRMTL